MTEKERLEGEFVAHIRRKAQGKEGTGRKRTKTELKQSRLEYCERLWEQVKSNMDMKDYLELLDIAVILKNPENAIDLAWRLGYLAGKAGQQNDGE